VIRVLRSEQRQAFAVQPDLVEVLEIRVAPLLASDAEEVQHPVLLVHVK
jgi:hypothetical protein